MADLRKAFEDAMLADAASQGGAPEADVLPEMGGGMKCPMCGADASKIQAAAQPPSGGGMGGPMLPK